MIKDAVQLADNEKFSWQPEQILHQGYGQMKEYSI